MILDLYFKWISRYRYLNSRKTWKFSLYPWKNREENLILLQQEKYVNLLMQRYWLSEKIDCLFLFPKTISSLNLTRIIMAYPIATPS